MATQKRSVLVADFETTTKPDDCRVWGWGLCDVEKATSAWDVEIGTDMDSFIERISKVQSTCYFHNLKFDGAFLLDWLFNNGYYRVETQPRRGEFTSLISNMGAFYSITVVWKNGKRTEFRDSLKKLPMKVSAVAESFKLPEPKGSIDYHLERPVGWVITPLERRYIAADVLIVARALKIQFDSGMKKLTVGSDSLHNFKEIMNPKLFDAYFPVLANTMDAEIRLAYRGGFTYAAKRFQKKRTRSGRVYDVNSLYPYIMYDRLLPYGEPVYTDGMPVATAERPLFIVSITFTAKLKKNHIPCIQVKNIFGTLDTEYQEIIDDPVTMTCTNVDLALWEEHYDLDILCYNGGWLFKATTGLFNEFIDKWMEIKNNNEGGIKQIAKLMLNSLYGKFVTNPNVTQKIPVFNYEKNIVQLKMGSEEIKNPVYTAMGVFITAYARDKTIRAAQEHYDVFAYADTDSLHLLMDDDPASLDIDPKKLGAWKFEYAFKSAIFVRAKAYIERKHDGEYITHIAGLPDDIAHKATFVDFKNGRRFTGKLVPKRVPGGIVLEDASFTLNM